MDSSSQSLSIAKYHSTLHYTLRFFSSSNFFYHYTTNWFQSCSVVWFSQLDQVRMLLLLLPFYDKVWQYYIRKKPRAITSYVISIKNLKSKSIWISFVSQSWTNFHSWNRLPSEWSPVFFNFIKRPPCRRLNKMQFYIDLVLSVIRSKAYEPNFVTMLIVKVCFIHSFIHNLFLKIYIS